MHDASPRTTVKMNTSDDRVIVVNRLEMKVYWAGRCWTEYCPWSPFTMGWILFTDCSSWCSRGQGAVWIG